MVGRAGSRPDPGADPANHRRQRSDRSLDHRRHRLSEERPSFGRGGASILRPAGPAGQLSEPAPAKAGVAVSLSLANHAASLPIAWRLYLTSTTDKPGD